MIYFSPAATFDRAVLNPAQRDDELRRHRISPGQDMRITTASGQSHTPIGDVRYTQQSEPYWLSSWTLGVDLRLFDEFAHNNPQNDTLLVVWNPEEFGERIDRAVSAQRPGWLFADIPIRYIDPYDPGPFQKHPVSATKHLPYAIQRELRLAMRPPVPLSEAAGFEIYAGSMVDIAGVYDAAGRKIRGSGPGDLVVRD